MNYLLDTMALLRLADGRAPAKVMRRLERAGTLFASIVSPWEVALKRIPGISNDEMVKVIESIDARLLPVTMEHIGILAKLPEFREHRDPFDRMLIAQALDARCPIVSADTRFGLYRAIGLEVLWN